MIIAIVSINLDTTTISIIVKSYSSRYLHFATGQTIVERFSQHSRRHFSRDDHTKLTQANGPFCVCPIGAVGLIVQHVLRQAVMQASLLEKVFGNNKKWSGPCILVLDADATVQASGTDAIVNAGAKMYAPRLITGRINADSVCFLPDEASLVVLQWERIRQATSKDQFQQTVAILDVNHVAALEFSDGTVLEALGLSSPDAAPAHMVRSSR